MYLCALSLKLQWCFWQTVINMSDFNSLKPIKNWWGHISWSILPQLRVFTPRHLVWHSWVRAESQPGVTAWLRTDHLLLAGQSLRHISSLKPSSTQLHSSWCKNKGRAAKGARNCTVPGPGHCNPTTSMWWHQHWCSSNHGRELGWATILFYSGLISEGVLHYGLTNDCETLAVRACVALVPPPLYEAARCWASTGHRGAAARALKISMSLLKSPLRMWVYLWYFVNVNDA